MRLSEKIDHLLRQYSYRKKRSNTHHKNKNYFDLEEYLEEINSYLEEVQGEIHDILPKFIRKP